MSISHLEIFHPAGGTAPHPSQFCFLHYCPFSQNYQSPPKQINTRHKLTLHPTELIRTHICASTRCGAWWHTNWLRWWEGSQVLSNLVPVDCRPHGKCCAAWNKIQHLSWMRGACGRIRHQHESLSSSRLRNILPLWLWKLDQKNQPCWHHAWESWCHKSWLSKADFTWLIVISHKVCLCFVLCSQLTHSSHMTRTCVSSLCYDWLMFLWLTIVSHNDVMIFASDSHYESRVPCR